MDGDPEPAQLVGLIHRHAPLSVGDQILLLPGSIATWSTVSVVIEVAFVVLTVLALLAQASHTGGASLLGET